MMIVMIDKRLFPEIVANCTRDSKRNSGNHLAKIISGQINLNSDRECINASVKV